MRRFGEIQWGEGGFWGAGIELEGILKVYQWHCSPLEEVKVLQDA